MLKRREGKGKQTQKLSQYFSYFSGNNKGGGCLQYFSRKTRVISEVASSPPVPQTSYQILFCPKCLFQPVDTPFLALLRLWSRVLGRSSASPCQLGRLLLQVPAFPIGQLRPQRGSGKRHASLRNVRCIHLHMSSPLKKDPGNKSLNDDESNGIEGPHDICHSRPGRYRLLLRGRRKNRQWFLTFCSFKIVAGSY